MIGVVSRDERERFFELAAEHTPYIGATVGSGTYLVRTEDVNVGKSLFIKGTRGEMLQLRRAIALVQKTLGDDALDGTVFLDVGANIGTTTIPALLDGPFATAICFEPEPSNVLNLRLNLLLNGLEERARVVAVAVSDATGTASLVADTKQSGKGWIAVDEKHLASRAPGQDVLSVPTTTLDELTETGVVDLERVGMLWMDAQAHEGHILAGAGRLREHGVPVVLEWYPRSLDRFGSVDDLHDSLAEHYTHFVDLRKPTSAAASVRAVGTIGAYAENFDDPAGPRYTDILLLRLSQEVAAQLDVEGAPKRAKAVAAGRPDRPRAARPRRRTRRRRRSPSWRPRASARGCRRPSAPTARRLRRTSTRVRT